MDGDLGVELLRADAQNHFCHTKAGVTRGSKKQREFSRRLRAARRVRQEVILSLVGEERGEALSIESGPHRSIVKLRSLLIEWKAQGAPSSFPHDLVIALIQRNTRTTQFANFAIHVGELMKHRG
jgi:hypothetical protein